MRLVKNPSRSEWQELIRRPDFDQSVIQDSVQNILSEVGSNGDKALLDFTNRFDQVKLKELRIDLGEINPKLDRKLKDAIDLAIRNVEKFHRSQISQPKKITTSDGVECWRKSLPIDCVGLYIPGGTAPLLSSLIMLGVPAMIAGCREITVCTPPASNGEINPAIIYIAKKLGIDTIYPIGGAQAVAAMAYGTETVPKVDKIFGPGNRYVTLAKQMAQQSGTAIDMPAGPSEVLVIADASSNPSFVAADLLSQAEHGSDSQVVLVLSEEAGNLDNFMNEVEVEISDQLEKLPRKEMASRALENSLTVTFPSEDLAMEFSNSYAPEHLILTTRNPSNLAEKVRIAGSVFIGQWSCESLGDYASGTNHTLPTNAYARNYSGVSLDSFVNKITFQEVTREGIKSIGPAVELLAEAEGLQAHKNAVSIRLK